MTTLNKNSVIVVKDIKNGSLANRRVSTFLTMIGGARQMATIEKHINERSVRPILDRYLVGVETSEVGARLPTFSLKTCKYKVLKKGNDKSRSFRSKNDAAAYSTGTIAEFNQTVLNILEGTGCTYGMTPCGDMVTILPPVPVKCEFHIAHDSGVTGEVDLLRKLRADALNNYDKAVAHKDGYELFEIVVGFKSPATILPVYLIMFKTFILHGFASPARVTVAGRDLEDAISNFRKCIISGDQGTIIQGVVDEEHRDRSSITTAAYLPIVL